MCVENSEALDELLTEIMREYMVEAETPPQIVNIPDSDAQYSYLTVCLSKEAVEVLNTLSNSRFGNAPAAARAILNVVTAYIHKRTKGGDTG